MSLSYIISKLNISLKMHNINFIIVYFFSTKGNFNIHHGSSGTRRVAVPSEQDVCTESVYMSSSRVNGPKRGERETD